MSNNKVQSYSEISAIGQKATTLFGIQAKPGILKRNLAYIFFLNIFRDLIGECYVSMKQPLLMNKNYYNLDLDQTTKLMNESQSFTTIPSIIVTFIGGYIYDVFGRKFTIYYMILIGGLSLVFFPIVAPSQYMYIFLVSVYTFFLKKVISNNPLINDYVENVSMGKANSLSLMGSATGTIISMSGLFELTKNMEPRHGWGLISCICVIFALISLFVVVEPKEVFDDSKNDQGNIWKLTKIAFGQILTNGRLAFGYVLVLFWWGPECFFSIYMMSWLNGFYDPDNGPIKDKDEVLNLYQIQGTIGSCIVFVLLAGFGQLADKVSAKVMMPLSFFLRGVMFLLTYTITDPRSNPIFYTAVPLTHSFMFLLNVVVLSELQKEFAKETRGVLNSLVGVMCSVGYYLFLVICQRLYENHGRAAPILGVCILDFVATALIILVNYFLLR